MTDSFVPRRDSLRTALLPSSKLAVLTALGTVAGALPLPYLPSRVQRRLRGALIHDIAARHGLSVTADAREVLASPSTFDAPAARWLSGALGYAARRVLKRVGPLALLPPVKSGLDTFALGLLFERYLHTVRRGPAVRIHAAEARSVREIIDRALVRAFHPTLELARVAALPAAAEDLRDDATRFIDSLVLAGANLPSYLVRRLESAFDAVIAEHPNLVGG